MMIVIPVRQVNGQKLNLETDRPRTAKVIEVIDGEVIKVLFYYSDFQMPEVKVVKLLGINTYGKQEAFEHTLTSLLGQVVFIVEESNASFPNVDNLDAIYGYVFNSMSRSMNEELLMNGYAMVDPAFEDARYYADLIAAENIAKQKEVGFFIKDTGTVQAMFNINTASFETMQANLIDTTDEAIQNIIAYRTYNMFETVGEVKYADPSLNHDWLEANKGLFTAITNVNNANTYELASLFSGTADPIGLAETLEQYKVFNEIGSITELKSISGVSNYYSAIEPFIDTKPESLHINTSIKVANINTCSASDLTAATGLSQGYWNLLDAQRKYNNYYYKSIGEVLVQGAPLYSYATDRYSDNITAFTNLNTANQFELATLFSIYTELTSQKREALANDIIAMRPYSQISDIKTVVESKYYYGIYNYIYVSDNDLPKSLNINMTYINTLDSYLGMTNLDVSSYNTYIKDHGYINPDDINFNISGKGHKVSLFTDINSASSYELLNLNRSMTQAIVDEIMTYRESEPITSLDEILYIFTKYNRSYLYLELADYVVFR